MSGRKKSHCWNSDQQLKPLPIAMLVVALNSSLGGDSNATLAGKVTQGEMFKVLCNGMGVIDTCSGFKENYILSIPGQPTFNTVLNLSS